MFNGRDLDVEALIGLAVRTGGHAALLAIVRREVLMACLLVVAPVGATMVSPRTAAQARLRTFPVCMNVTCAGVSKILWTQNTDTTLLQALIAIRRQWRLRESVELTQKVCQDMLRKVFRLGTL